MKLARKPFIATRIDLVDHRTLIPADYNPREMDERTLRLLVRSLARFGWVLPVVANRRTGNIVGGHQRTRANEHIIRTHGPRAAGFSKVPVIYVDLSVHEEKALNVALNQISGDWDFFKKAAADELRQNATFAQMTRIHHELSRGYKAPLGLLDFSFKSKEHFQQFVSFYGTRILDFGCGKGQEIEWLGKLGIRAVGFEPFRRVKGRDKLDIAISRGQADGLLNALTAGFVPDTVFCNFVISSIASPREREHVVRILQALSVRAARVVIAVRSTHDVCYQQVLGRARAKTSGYLGVPDASEPGLIVTGAGTARQKFQKFYDAGEFTRWLRRFFGAVEIHALERNDPALVAVCSEPKKLDPVKLAKALRFEFDLPIDGERIDRGSRAFFVFKRWLGKRGQRPGSPLA